MDILHSPTSHDKKGRPTGNKKHLMNLGQFPGIAGKQVHALKVAKCRSQFQ